MPITTKLIAGGGAVMLAVIVLLYGLLSIEQAKLETAETKLQQTIGERDAALESNRKQAERISAFNQIGEKSAQELSSAKNEIESLRDQLNRSPKRVYVNADCPAGMSEADSAGSVVDAGTATLGGAAQQDYLRLREMMATSRQQVLYLQDYIKSQCLTE